MNISVFGKTLENIRNRVDIRLISSDKVAQKLAVKPNSGGKQIVEFVGFRAKLYSYKMLDDSEDKKCKGVTKNVTKRSIQFDDYREYLFSRKEQHRKMNVLRSHCHEIYIEEIK